MNETQLALITAQTKETKLDLIVDAIKADLIGGTIDGSTVTGNSFFKDLLQDDDRGGPVLYNYSFINKLATFDPGFAVYHTNNEIYDKNENGGIVGTIGLVYLECLIRHQDPDIANNYIGRILDKARVVLMPNTNLTWQVNKWRFMKKETLNVNERVGLFTRIGRLHIECKYNPQAVLTR